MDFEEREAEPDHHLDKGDSRRVRRQSLKEGREREGPGRRGQPKPQVGKRRRRMKVAIEVEKSTKSAISGSVRGGSGNPNYGSQDGTQRQRPSLRVER